MKGLGFLLLIIFGVGALSGQTDQLMQIRLTPPRISIPQLGQTHPEYEEIVNTGIAEVTQELQARVSKTPELSRLSSINLLPRGLVNASATSSGIKAPWHAVLRESMVTEFGTGVSFVYPNGDFPTLEALETKVEQLEDSYLGVGIKPVSAGLGIPVRITIRQRRVPMLLWVQAGYLGLQDYAAIPGTRYKSWGAALGSRIQLVAPQTLLRTSKNRRILSWSGIFASFSVHAQQSSLTVEPDLPEYKTDPIRMKDIGLSQDDIDQLNSLMDSDITQNTQLGYLRFEPEISAVMTISSMVLPIELSSALAVPGIISLGFRVGMDLSIGGITVALTSGSPIYIEPNPQTTEYFSYSPAHATVALDLYNKPTLLRPRLGVDITFNIGPFYLSVPSSISFDSLGTTLSAGVFIGMSW